MKISKQGKVQTKPAGLHPDIPEAISQPADMFESASQIAEGMSRRTFLYSLGALALSACGGRGEDSASGQASPVAQSAVVARDAARGSSSSGSFVHPGLLHTQADFNRMAQKVAAQASPWVDSWNLLTANRHASLSWTPNPQAVLSRGNDGMADNSGDLYNDVAAAYQCALRWQVTGNTAYADKAVQIMNAWSSTLSTIDGATGVNSDYDGILMAGIQGYQFANVGEMMRTYTGWAASDFTAFQNMMLNVFYPVNNAALPQAINVYANWDLCCVASILAIGVLCDNQTLFNQAITYFQTGQGNGNIAQSIYYMFPGYLGQMQEAGRDQGHNTLDMAHLGVICEMAWNQGIDLYGYDNNRFLAGAEYTAKGNLIESGTTYYTVPFVPYLNINIDQTVFSTNSQGTVRPCWALIYNHYVNRQGLAAPYTGKMMAVVSPEGGGGDYGPNSGGFDQLGFGTLTCTLDPIAQGAAPGGLAGYLVDGSVVLSWWGTANATGYTVQRGTTSGGPYATIATGITDLLTYTDSGLAAGTYYYAVNAQTPTGDTALSTEAMVIANPQQLLAYLPFNASSGTVAADSSGNGNNGTLVGGATWVAGHDSNAVSLDGISGYVSLPANIVENLSDFTIATWIYLNKLGSSVRLFSFGAGVNRLMMFTPQWGSGNARFGISVDNNSGMQFVDAPNPLPTGTWTHVAITLSGTLGTIYLNGSAVGTNSSMYLAPFQLSATPQNWIGRSQDPSNAYLDGIVDEFRVYQGALTAAQISALAAS